MSCCARGNEAAPGAGSPRRTRDHVGVWVVTVEELKHTLETYQERLAGIGRHL